MSSNPKQTSLIVGNTFAIFCVVNNYTNNTIVPVAYTKTVRYGFSKHPDILRPADRGTLIADNLVDSILWGSSSVTSRLVHILKSIRLRDIL